MKPQHHVIAALLLAVPALSGCSAPPTADAATSARPADPVASHLLVSTWVNGDDGMLGLYGGVLVAQLDGCVGLRASGAAKPVLLSWPAGSTLARDGLTVRGSSGKTFRLGDEVSLGGGFGGRNRPVECDASVWCGVFEIQQPL